MFINDVMMSNAVYDSGQYSLKNINKYKYYNDNVHNIIVMVYDANP